MIEEVIDKELFCSYHIKNEPTQYEKEHCLLCSQKVRLKQALLGKENTK
jgi:hypothetical protein